MSAFADNREALLTELRDTLQRVDEAQIAAAVDLLVQCKDRRVVVLGVGREGLAARGFAMRLAHAGYQVHWGWDDTTIGVHDGDLLVMVNGSGSIGHLDYVFDRLTPFGVRSLVVTGAPSGRVPRTADVCLCVPGAVYRGSDPVVDSIQPMGSLFEQAVGAVLDLIILELMRELGLDMSDLATRHRNFE